MSLKACIGMPLVFLFGLANPVNENVGRLHSLSYQRSASSGIFLKYEGNITGQSAMPLELRFEIDSTIGLRYDFEMSQGGKGGFSHMVIYYRFDNPNQCILYNNITKQKTVLSGGNSNGNSAGVFVVGKELVNGYNCTHLRQINGKTELFNYWMSTDLPGYRTLLNILPAIKATDAMESINTSIFNWGGLVKLRGGNTSAQINLDITEALLDTSYLATDFQVPGGN